MSPRLARVAEELRADAASAVPALASDVTSGISLLVAQIAGVGVGAHCRP